MTNQEIIAMFQTIIAALQGSTAPPVVVPPVVAPPVSVPPVVVPPVVGPPPPVLPVGFTKGTQYENTFRFRGATLSHAEKNFNWIMDYYGSSYAYLYMVVSYAPLVGKFQQEWLAQGLMPGRDSYIINVFAGAMGPANRPIGVLLPSAANKIVGGNTMPITWPAPGFTIILPFHDDLVTV